MKKYLFISFFLGTLCEASFSDVARKSSIQKRFATPKTVDQMSDAELDRLIGRLVGERDASSEGVEWQSSSKREESDEQRIERIEAAVDESSAAESKAFPTGFSLGVGIAQTWDVARNHTKVWYVKEAEGENPFKPRGLPPFSKTKRVKLDPAFNVGYSVMLKDAVWFAISGEVSFGSSFKIVRAYTFEEDRSKSYKEKSEINGAAYSLLLKPGYVFEEYGVVLYGILGLKRRHICVKPLNQELAEKLKVDQNKILPVFGVGLEKQVCGNLSFNIEYEYCWRSSCFKKRRDGLEKTNDEFWKKLSCFGRDGKVTLGSNSVKLGLKYYF